MHTMNSCAPVQVVKPTLRTERDMTQSSKVTDSGGFVPVGLSTNNNNNPVIVNENNASGDTMDDEVEFEWNEYLDSCGAAAALPTSFPHVESSLQTLFTPDMKMEVPNRQCPGSYWVAAVVMTCGPLLRLRYEGYGTDRSADFWCEIGSGEIHPLGWCKENGKSLVHPPALGNTSDYWDHYLKFALKDATTVPPYLLEAKGCTAIDQIKQGMKLEIQDASNPMLVWIATIQENVGGRLLLRYDAMPDGTEDFWLFYLSYRVHPVGWTKDNPDYKYQPPAMLSSLNPNVAAILEDSVRVACNMPVPSIIFKNQEKIGHHRFQEGMRLEAINMVTLTHICPATVTKVLSPYYFVVELDQPNVETHPMFCHARSPTIFPAGWSAEHGVSVTFPKGWHQEKEEFDWDSYLESVCKASGKWSIERAPADIFEFAKNEHGFEDGMKLEAVNPFEPSHICAATISRVVAHLIWIQLDNLPSSHPNYIVAASSHDLFPVGWCDSNHYSLKIPVSFQNVVKRPSAKKVAIVIPKKKLRLENNNDEDHDLTKGVREFQASGKAWCPEIYVNHKCFSGPFLSKARLAGLPRHVGPGPVTLVLKEVISLIVGVSYLPSRVLGILQLQGEPSPGTNPQLIKAKHKQKTYRATVEILHNSDKVGEYCREVCRKLQCCPNLFGPDFIGENCPENCYTLTKTTNVALKKGKKKRKYRTLVTLKKMGSEFIGNDETRTDGNAHQGQDNTQSTDKSANQEMENDNRAVYEEERPKTKRKYVHRIMPKSDIVTRGAKLPNFALQLRRRSRKSVAQTYVSRLTKSLHNKPGPARRVAAALAKEQPCRKAFLVRDQSVGNTLSAQPAIAGVPNTIVTPRSEVLHLYTNPLLWNVSEVVTFIKGTDCAHMARLLKEQEIDGQALLLLTLPTIQEHLDLKLGPAIKLCHQIERVKLAFYSQFVGC